MLLVFALLWGALSAAASDLPVPAETISLNLRDAQRTAYLKPGFVSLAIYPKKSLLVSVRDQAASGGVNYPQFGLQADSISFTSDLNPNLATVIFPRLDRNYTVLLQVDKSNTVYFSVFAIVDDAYQPCSTRQVSPKLLAEDELIIGDSIHLIKALNETHTRHLINSLSDKQRYYFIGKQVAAFMNLNDETGRLLIVICDYSDKAVYCSQVYSRQVNTTDVVFINYQIFDDFVYVYLQSGIISLSLTQEERKVYSYEKNFKFLQYFHGEWYGISDTDSLCVLKLEVERGWYGQDFLNLKETYVYPVAVGLEYRDLTSTDNYLIAKFKDFINNKTGVSIFAFTNDSFFGSDPQNLPNKCRTDKSRLLQRPAGLGSSGSPDASDWLDCLDWDSTEPGSSAAGPRNFLDEPERVLKRIDYTDEGSLGLTSYYEWRGQVIMFGDRSLMILSVPPTLNAPKNMQMSYQTRGALNKTFSMNFSKILYVLPKSQETGSLAVVNSRVLKQERPGVQSHASASAGLGKSVLFIDEVSIGSPNLHFNQTDEELLEQKSCTIDVYYNEYPSFVRKRYVIEFVFNKSRRSLGLLVFLAVVVVIFVAITVLCIVKSCKALRKVADPASVATPNLALTPGLPDGNKRVLLRGAKDELVNQNIPSRLKNRDPVGV